MASYERARVPREGDERAMLTGFLQFQRDTLAMKGAGLSPEQLNQEAVPPSTCRYLGWFGM